MKYILGRGEKCHIRVESPTISEQHCSVQATPGGDFIIEDLESSNHTYINGIKIRISKLKPADHLAVADQHIDFNWLVQEVSRLDFSNRMDFRKEFDELKKVYEDHQLRVRSIDMKYRKKDILGRSLVSLLPSITGLLLPEGTGALELARKVLIGSSPVLISLILLFQGTSAKAQDEKEQENIDFQLKYRCPKCGVEFGNRHWKLIEANKNCTRCKAQFA